MDYYAFVEVDVELLKEAFDLPDELGVVELGVFKLFLGHRVGAGFWGFVGFQQAGVALRTFYLRVSRRSSETVVRGQGFREFMGLKLRVFLHHFSKEVEVPV